MNLTSRTTLRQLYGVEVFQKWFQAQVKVAARAAVPKLYRVDIPGGGPKRS